MNSTQLFRSLTAEFPGFNFPVPQTGLKIGGRIDLRMKATGLEFVNRTAKGLPVNITVQTRREIREVGPFLVDTLVINTIAPGEDMPEKQVWLSARKMELAVAA